MGVFKITHMWIGPLTATFILLLLGSACVLSAVIYKDAFCILAACALLACALWMPMLWYMNTMMVNAEQGDEGGK